MVTRFITKHQGGHRKVVPLSTLKKRKSSSVQSLLVSKKGKNLTQAKQRVKQLGFKTTKVDSSGNFFKFRQQNPEKVKVVGTIQLAPDVKARISVPKGNSRMKKDRNLRGIKIPSILPPKKTEEEKRKIKEQKTNELIVEIKEDADVRSELIKKTEALRNTVDTSQDEETKLGAKKQLKNEVQSVKKINSVIKGKIRKIDKVQLREKEATDTNFRNIVIVARAS